MSRLPNPGSDNGTWGNILNDFLAQVHKTDGSLKDDVVTSASLAPNAVDSAAIAPNAVDAVAIADGSITEVLLAPAVQTKLNAAGGTPDWSTITNKPAVIAAGADQAAARTAIGAGTASTKTDVGLGNVDNTSDANKNAAIATLTNKTISGASNTLTNIPESAITNLVSDLAGKAPVSHTHTVSNISDSTATGRAVVTATDATAARTAIGAGTASTKADVGLGNVDNTSDANKNAAIATLTNKTISGASNTITNIAQSSVTNLVSDLAGKEPTIAAGVTNQYYRGDKSWQTLDKTAVGLSSVNNTSDLNKPISTATQTALDAKADIVGGVVPTSQLPSLAFNTAVTVGSQSAMLALTSAQVQPGDLAIRSDGAGTFILTASDPSVLSNWTLLNSPTAPVTSVNSQTGNVVLGKADIGLGNIDNTSDLNKPISTATQTALDAKADLVGGYISTSQLPPLALNTAVTVASQAAMLALTTTQVQPGDLAIRTDGAGTFILTATDPSVLSNWQLLNTPTAPVTSVNTQTGAVVLSKSDVGLGNVDNTSDTTKNAATATLTNKTISGANNTITNIGLSSLSATGTANSSTYLRGDNSWQTITTLQSSTLMRPDAGGAVALAQNPPTISHATSATSGLKAYGYATVGTNWVGIGTNLVVSGPAMINDVGGYGFNQYAWEWETEVVGTILEVKWYSTYLAEPWMQIFIDDEPVTTTPFQPTGLGTITTNTSYYTKLTFSTVGPRKVRFRWENMAMQELRVNTIGSLQATKPSRPVIAMVGTSNSGYDPGTPRQYMSIQGWPWMVADALGMSAAQFGGNGGGYIAAPTYAGARLTSLIAVNPDYIIVEGSGNDMGQTYNAVKTAATSYYASLASNFPNTPVLVIGPMNTIASDDLSSSKSIVAAGVRDAAQAASNVVAFIDPNDIANSSGTIPSTYANSTAYTANQAVVYNGGIYRALSSFTSSTAAPDPTLWKQTSWSTGTGGSDFPNGDGTRDVLFNMTSGHSTPAGQRNYAYNILREVLKYLVNPVGGKSTRAQLTKPTLYNAVLSGTTTLRNGVDATKQVTFDTSGISTGTTRTLTLPNNSGTIALTSDIGASGGMLAPVQGMVNTETLTISSGSVTQITGTTVNGYTPSVGDRILIANANASSGAANSYSMTTQPANGIYVVTGNTTNLTVSRATDASGSNKPNGMSVYVQNATWPASQTLFFVDSPNDSSAFTWGTTSLKWNYSGGLSGQVRQLWIGLNNNSFNIYNGTGWATVNPAVNAGNQNLSLPATATDTIVARTSTDTLTNKTLTNPTINNYTEGVVSIGTVTSSYTLDLTNGTVQTATLTASTACTFTMPTAVAGKSFVLMLYQAAVTGNGTATFTGVKWNGAGAPTITATAGKMDILSFFSNGTSWYGSYTQGYTA